MILFYTGSIFLFLFLYFYKNIPIYFLIILFLQSIITPLFWYNAIENSNMHRVDGVITKIHIFSFLIYKIFYYKKNITIFIIFALITLYFLYLSHINSLKKWYSKKHILYHGLAHIFSGYCIYIGSL